MSDNSIDAEFVHERINHWQSQGASGDALTKVVAADVSHEIQRRQAVAAAEAEKLRAESEKSASEAQRQAEADRKSQILAKPDLSNPEHLVVLREAHQERLKTRRGFQPAQGLPQAGNYWDGLAGIFGR
jgi:regulator of protease activity HflC (stomatin/prohibitin superfamily)